MKLTRTQSHTLDVLREMASDGQAVHGDTIAAAMFRDPTKTATTLAVLQSKGKVTRAGAHWLPVASAKKRAPEPKPKPVTIKPTAKVMTAAEVWSIARRQRPKVKAPRQGWSPQLGAFAEERQ